MGKTILDLDVDALHTGQLKVYDGRKRYNMARCGRRWGKSTLAEYITLRESTQPVPLAYYAPTYRYIKPMWDSLRATLEPATVERSEAHKSIRLITGAQIDFWSLEDPDASRGRKYKCIVIDEAALVRKLEYAWQRTIRPTLTDLRGDAWLLSTGRGIGSYFNQMFIENREKEEWFTYTAPTSENPYISSAEIDEARRTMHPLAFEQEYMGHDVSWSEHAWCFAFEDLHIEEITFNPRQTVYLSFDFNVDPTLLLSPIVTTPAHRKGVDTSSAKTKHAHIHALFISESLTV